MFCDCIYFSSYIGYELRSLLWTSEKLYGRSVECANRAVTIAKKRLCKEIEDESRIIIMISINCRYGDHPITQEMLTLKVDCILERGKLKVLGVT